MHRDGKEMDKPQTTKTPNAVPVAARNKPFATCHRSIRRPIKRNPITIPAFMEVTGAVVPIPNSPTTMRAYVGRYRDGAKYPRLCRRFPI